MSHKKKNSVPNNSVRDGRLTVPTYLFPEAEEFGKEILPEQQETEERRSDDSDC